MFDNSPTICADYAISVYHKKININLLMITTIWKRLDGQSSSWKEMLLSTSLFGAASFKQASTTSAQVFKIIGQLIFFYFTIICNFVLDILINQKIKCLFMTRFYCNRFTRFCLPLFNQEKVNVNSQMGKIKYGFK